MKNAFTLIEMLVVIAIFFLIGGVISGMFISGISIQRKILTTQEILDQTSFLVEYIGRALRMAKKDDLEGTNCLSGEKVNYEITQGGRGIKFRNYKNDCQEFYLEGNQIKENKAGTIFPLTSQKISVKSLKFNLIGEAQEDNFQPRVTISLEIEGRGKSPSKFRIQTTISQRDLDVPY